MIYVTSRKGFNYFEQALYSGKFCSDYVEYILFKQRLMSTIRASMQRFKDCATASQMIKTNKLLVSGV